MRCVVFRVKKLSIIIFILIYVLSEFILKSNSAPTPTDWSNAKSDIGERENENKRVSTKSSISFYSSSELLGSNEDVTDISSENTPKKKKSRMNEEIHEKIVNITEINEEQGITEDVKYSFNIDEQILAPGAEIFSKVIHLLKNRKNIFESSTTLQSILRAADIQDMEHIHEPMLQKQEIPMEASSVNPEELLQTMDKPSHASGKSSRQLGGLGELATEAFGGLPGILRTLAVTVPSNIINFVARLTEGLIEDIAFLAEMMSKDALLLVKDWIDYVRYVRTYLRDQFLGTPEKPGTLRTFLKVKGSMAKDYFLMYQESTRSMIRLCSLLWETFKSKFIKKMDKFKKLWRAEWKDTVRDWIRNLRDRIRPVFQFTIKMLVTKKTALTDKVGRIYETILDCVKFIYVICNDILDVIDRAKLLIQDIIRAIIKRIQRKLEKVENFIRNWIDYKDQPLRVKIQNIWIRIRNFMRRVVKSIRTAYRAVMKRLRPKWKKIVRKYRSFITYMRNLFMRIRNYITKTFRNKYRKIYSTIYNFIRTTLRRIHAIIHRLLEKFDKITLNIRCRVKTYFAKIRRFLRLLVKRTRFFIKHIMKRIKYFGLKTYKFIKKWLRHLKNKDWRELKELIKPFTDYVKKVLKEIIKEVKYQMRFYLDMIDDLIKNILGMIKYIFRKINAKLDHVYLFIKKVLKKIAEIIDYVHDFIKTIAKAIFYVVKAIVIYIRIKKLDKWRWLAQGIYYFLYVAHIILEFLKSLLDIPYEVFKWLVDQIEQFKEWLRERIFERPGLFYVIGDIIRAVKNKSNIFGWLREEALKNIFVKWLVQTYGESELLQDLAKWINDGFVKQWIQWHVFRSTTTSTTTTPVPDVRPHFIHETILDSFRLLGDPNNDEKLPRSIFDKKMAGSIGTYLYDILNGKRDTCCGRLPPGFTN